MKVLNLTKGTVIAEEARLANTFSSRMTGLLNRKNLNPKEALIITRCRSIHMLFMRFSIDAIFVDKSHKVVGLVHGIKPFRLSPIFFKASYVVEAPEGTIKDTHTSLGDFLEIKV